MGSLSGSAKRCVKRWFGLFGLEVRRAPRYTAYGWLRELGIRTVLDIGANVGQFASRIHRILPEAMIYSFEPLEDCCRQLRKTMEGVEAFRAFNLALGDKSGREKIYRNDYTPTSSLLPVEDLLRQSFPFASHTTPQEIEIRRLDDLDGEAAFLEPMLIKIDVQGTEDKVILGGTHVLSRASVLIIETSFQTLYKGQPLFDSVYDLLRKRGFAYMGTEDTIRGPKDGRVLQCDSVFMRRASEESGKV